MTIGQGSEQGVSGGHGVAEGARLAPSLLGGGDDLGQRQAVIAASTRGGADLAQQLGSACIAHPSIIAFTSDRKGVPTVTSMIDLHGLDVPIPPAPWLDEPLPPLDESAVTERAGEILADCPRPMGAGEARTLARRQLIAERACRS